MTVESHLDPWLAVDEALIVLDRDIRGGSHPLGLRDYQEDIVRHTLRHLAAAPGLVVAERTGRGKSQVAMAVIAALARAAVGNGSGPVRVGLLAPNANVLGNWIGERGLFQRAYGDPDDNTYIWRDAPIAWRARCIRTGDSIGSEIEPALDIYADHYTFGIAYGFGNWGKHPHLTRKRAEEFVPRNVSNTLDLLIIDEAHQLKSTRTGRAKAIEALFGGKEAPLPARRVLLLTATPFQLRAAPELARLIRILRWPLARGASHLPPDVVPSMSSPELQRLFDGFERGLASWLRLRIANLEADAAHSAALSAKVAVETLLRKMVVRTDVPLHHVQSSYGHPDPNDGSPLPDPAKGLSTEDALERLLFLAWDGSIASRTTFVASEQQTLSSSAAALRRRQGNASSSATERTRRPIGPPRIQQALFDLALRLAAAKDDDHVKVRSTIAAVARRALGGDGKRPTLVFAERTETLQTLQAGIRAAADCSVAIVDGGSSGDARANVIAGFKSSNRQDRIHVVLASKVAEMGLDIDGPDDREDMWLIHHDFPWNPAMVDQRNGRVYRPAKGEALRPVKITYPFIRDTVDERIFKRMLLRQALAELLLGTEEVARALRLTDQSELDSLALEQVTGTELRQLTPDLSPKLTTPPTADAQPEQLLAEPPPPAQPPIDDARPAWCPIELVELAESRMTAEMTESLRHRITALADDLCGPCWWSGTVAYLSLDLVGRRQTVVLGIVGSVIEAISLADTHVDAERIFEAFSRNAEPGAAGLMLVTDAGGSERIVARAGNLLETLNDGELRRLVLDCARRADEWEAAHHDGEDRW